MEIAGTSAVITGGGNGIGHAIALALACEGANVAVADLEPDAADRVAGDVEALGVRALERCQQCPPRKPRTWCSRASARTVSSC